MSKSEIILNAISKTIKNCEELKFLSRIKENGHDKFLCLGKENLIILETSFEQVRTIGYYAIDNVEIDNRKGEITLTIKGSPKYTFGMDDMEGMIETLQCNWVTDYMFRNAEYKEFPLKIKWEREVKRDERIEAAKAAIKTDQVGIKTGEFKGYGFLINSEFRAIPSKPGKYENARGNTTFTIEVSDEHSVQLIPLMGMRQELQNFAESYARSIVPKKGYWIVWSKPYLKKWNINEDIASWEGWEVFLRTKQHDYIVIIMRRKFLPPLLDLFNDIACWYKGDIVLDSPLESNSHLLQARGIVDTLHSKSKCDDYYSEIVRLKEEALLLGDDELNYIESVHERSNTVHKQLAKDAAKILRKYKENKSGQAKESRGKSADVMKTVKAMCKKANPPEGAKHTWECKVAHFLASSLDMEEDVSILALANSIVNLDISSDDALKIENLLQYLLHLRPAGSFFDSAHPFPTLLVQFTSTLLQEQASIHYLYNAHVMRVLIESGYISKILKLEKVTAYKRFVDSILMNTTDNKLRLSALRQVRDVFKDEFSEKKKTDEQSLINYSLWLKPVVSTLRLNWSLLVQVALNALTQMLSTNQIIKDQLYTYPELVSAIMETCMNVKDDDTLEFALLPLYVLSDDKVFCETLVREHNLIGFLFGLLKGTGIPGVNHTDDINIRVIYVLGKTCDNYPEAIQKVENECNIEYAINLVKIYNEAHFPSLDVIKAVTALMNLLAKKSHYIKQVSGKGFIPAMMDILNKNAGKEILPPEILIKIGKTLYEFGRNSPENCKIIADYFDVIEKYKKGHKSVATTFTRLLDHALENIQLEKVKKGN